MDVIEYMSRYIPTFVRYKGQDYVFQLFINHAHYDIRICYQADNGEWMLLYENNANQADLLDSLKLMRKALKKKRLLPAMYSKYGYTKKAFIRWSNKK